MVLEIPANGVGDRAEKSLTRWLGDEEGNEMVGRKSETRATRGRTLWAFTALAFLFSFVLGQTSMIATAAPSNLDAGGINLDLIAAGPGTYDHATGVGGAFNDRTISKTIGVVESLEGEDFACGDLVVFFTEVVVENGAGEGAADLTYTFDGQTTSGSHVGYDDLVSVSINDPDSGNENLDGDEGASIISEQKLGFGGAGNDRVVSTIRVHGLDGGDTAILRFVLHLYCDPTETKVTGNIHVTLDSAAVVDGARIQSGEQTVPLKQAGNILVPGLNVTKSCPATSSVGETITYTITVENTGTDALHDLVVTDPLLSPDPLEGFPSTLEAGASVSVDFTYEVGANPDPLTNIVTATATAGQSGFELTDTADCEVDVLPPALDIEKDAVPAEPVSSGDEVGFTIVVSNAGPGAAFDVELEDVLPSATGLSWTIDDTTGGWECAIAAGTLTCGGDGFDLGSGDSASVTVVSPTTHESCGVLDNTAFADSSNGPEVDDGASVRIDCPLLDLVKTADDTLVDAGEDIGFTLTVTNNGDGTAKGVVLTDTLPTDDGLSWSVDGAGAGLCSIANGVVTCQVGTLASGATFTVHLSSPTDFTTCGVVDNTGSVTSTNDGSDEDSDSVRVNCPALDIEKDAVPAEPVSSGDEVGFTIVVSNAGPGAAFDVELEDVLPSATGLSWTIDDTTGGWECAIAAGTLTCGGDGFDLGSGDSASVTVVSPTTHESCGVLDNTAFADSSNGPEVDDGASVRIDCPLLDLVKTADDTLVDAGEDIGFTLTVTNNGDGTAKGVVLTDTLPTDDGLSWSVDGAGAGLCSIANGVVTCQVGTLASGATFTVHLSSPTDFTTCGVVDNTGSVTSTNDGSDEDSDSVRVNCPALGIDIQKGGPELAHVGDTISYTFDVSLTTPEALYNVTVTDPNCNEGAPRYVSGDDGDTALERGEVWTYTCTRLVTEDDPDPLPNTATVTGSSDDGRKVSDQDDHQVDLIHPAIQIVKTVNPVSGEPGDEVTYRYVVTNIGDTTLYDVTVDDDIIGHIGSVDVLEVGGSVTLKKDWILPSEGVLVTNVGTTAGTDVLGEVVSDGDDATVTIVEAETPPPTAFTGSTATPFAIASGVLLALGLLALAASRRRGVARG